MMKKFCPNCGHPLKPNAAFCPNCGFKLKGQSLTQSTQTVHSDSTRGSLRKRSRTHSKRSKIIFSIIGILIIALLGLYFWGSNYHNTAQPKKVNHTSRMIGKSSHPAPVGHLSSVDQTPKRVVSVVVTYAGKKYPEEWGSALNNGKNNEWQINLKKRSDYPYMHQGSVAYMVTNDLGYTLTPTSDNGMQIYLFADKEQVGSASYGQMVNYLNHHNGEKTVKLLQKNAINPNDERGNSLHSQKANQTVNVPKGSTDNFTTKGNGKVTEHDVVLLGVYEREEEAGGKNGPNDATNPEEGKQHDTVHNMGVANENKWRASHTKEQYHRAEDELSEAFSAKSKRLQNKIAIICRSLSNQYHVEI